MILINKSLKIDVTHVNPYDDNCPKLLLDIVPQCESFVFISGETTNNCTSQLVLLSLEDNPNSVTVSVNQFSLSYSYKLIF